MHDLVVELSLNGRSWEGQYTRAWTLCGRGGGAAVACAYAARYPGRVAALVLVDYDPAWRKDHLAFSLFQAAHFASKEAYVPRGTWTSLPATHSYSLLPTPTALTHSGSFTTPPRPLLFSKARR